jgi:sugar phosphate permease
MTAADPPVHSKAFKTRRVLNWFPMGVTYALLYMARYNLTVAKNSLGELMTKEDFGIIFGAGTVCYAIAFLVNGPLIDRIGGRRGILLAAGGAAVANLVMGAYVWWVIDAGADSGHKVLIFSLLYAINMYFQSFGAVSVVKVNAHWFHVNERGGFSGIFGTMISSGLFLAFTVNGWLLTLADSWWPDKPAQWIVFLGPALFLGAFTLLEFFLLKDTPGDAGHRDFDTGDASSGDTSSAPEATLALLKRILTHPVILVVAAIEFCTGILRNGVMHWFPIYAKEVWVLPKQHLLMEGEWENPTLLVGSFAAAALLAFAASRLKGSAKGWVYVVAGLLFLSPFVQGGWGGLLFIAGVVGGNVAGWVSDLFFQSRRGPAVAGLYGALILLAIAMVFTLAPAHPDVAVPAKGSGLLAGDRVLVIAGRKVEGWADVSRAVACWQPVCKNSSWDAGACMCTGQLADPNAKIAQPAGFLPAKVLRQGQTIEVMVKDPKPSQRAGDHRLLADRPELPMSPWWLGLIVVLVSVSVIGSHGLLSGTATMDFGGKKGAATAVGVIDGFVYLGTALQSVSLGFLTSQDWFWWPIFLIPFAALGFALSLRIWNSKPNANAGH